MINFLIKQLAAARALPVQFRAKAVSAAMRWLSAVLALMVTFTAIFSLLPSTANAWTITPPAAKLPTCSSLHSGWSFTSWDWKSAIKSNINWTSVFASTDTVDTVVVNGSKKTGIAYTGPVAITIFQDNGANAGASTNYVLVQFSQAQGQSFYWNSSVTHHYNFTEPQVIPGTQDTFKLDMSAHTVVGVVGQYSDPSDVATGGSSDITCIEASTNVIEGQFGTSQGLYSGVIPGTSRDCSGLRAITCAVIDTFAGIANDLVNVAQAILKGLATLFVPNGTQLSSDWTSFYSTLSNKLGFLLWPFTFVGGLFSAMVTPTTTCCTIGAGTIFGAHWSGINLIYVETANPDIWSLAVTVVRAATILLLFFFLRDKFLEITHK